MKIKELMEMATVAGGIATVSKPMGETQKRNQGVKVAGLEPAEKVISGKAKKKGPYVNSLSEGKMADLAESLTEDDLSEQDLIIVPGQKMKRKTGFIQHGQSRVDHEVEMARSDVLATMKNAKAIYEFLKNRSEDEGLEGWVQEKLIKANDYLNSVKEYYDEKMMQEMTGGVIAAGGVGENLEEIDRRGLLKGIGAVAGLGAAGLGGWSAGYTTARDRNSEWDHGFLDGFLLIPKSYREDAQTILDIKNQTSHARQQLGKDIHNQQFYKKGYREGEQIYKQMFPKGHWVSKENREQFLTLAKTVAKRIDLGPVYEEEIIEGKKVDRMVQHIKKSEIKSGKSAEKAEDIAWATVNKRGYLDNKNKKKGK